MYFRNKQEVQRGFRLNVMKREKVFILVYLAGRNGPGGDLAENAVRIK
jgi:hypothetical protein